MSPGRVSERALVLAPLGRDAQVARSLLAEAGMSAVPLASLAALVHELEQGAALAIVTEETLRHGDIASLAEWLGRQEEWSDFPFILLTERAGGLERNPAAARFLKLLGNVTFLERPFHPTTLVSLAHAALRARQRQYDARARLQELDAGERRYRSLFDSIDAGFCIIEVLFDDGGVPVDYRFVETNPAFRRQTGLDDVVNQTIRTIKPDHEQHWFDKYGHVAKSLEPTRFEDYAAALGRWYDVYAFPTADPHENHVAVLFNDITVRRNVEEQLRQLTATLEKRVEEATAEHGKTMAQLHEAQKLETLGQLTGGVAHDFNNLLTPITGALDLLLRRMGDGGDPRSHRLITNALESADRAKILVQRLLGFARRQILESRPVAVHALLAGMRDLIETSVGSAITLDLALEHAPPAMVDPNQLELAILNLCVNARDAMPDGGTITISLRPIELASGVQPAVAPGSYISLTVRDTGHGMDAQTVAKAIEPFYSTKPVGKGTGLGLSMVHGLMLQLGGGLRIASEPGQGAAIELLLPVAKGEIAAVDAPERRHDAVTSEQPLNVLLVDDEALVRGSVAEMLRALGHRVEEAASGREALDRLHSAAFDLIITDYKMPSMSGEAIADEVRRRTPEIPVLIITGYTGETVGLGVARLQKPFCSSDLARAIRSATQVSAGFT